MCHAYERSDLYFREHHNDSQLSSQSHSHKLDIRGDGSSNFKTFEIFLHMLRMVQSVLYCCKIFMGFDVIKIKCVLVYNVNLKRLTHLSKAIATRCSIDAVQQRTSLDVHISHNSGPSDHSRDTSYTAPKGITKQATSKSATAKDKIK